MGSWRKRGRVYSVLRSLIYCWHLIWKWSMERVIWFSFVGAHLKTGGWTLWPPGFLPTLKSGGLSDSQVKVKLLFQPSDRYLCHAFELTKQVPTGPSGHQKWKWRKKKKKKNPSVKARLEYTTFNTGWYFSGCHLQSECEIMFSFKGKYVRIRILLTGNVF